MYDSNHQNVNTDTNLKNDKGKEEKFQAPCYAKSGIMKGFQVFQMVLDAEIVLNMMEIQQIEMAIRWSTLQNLVAISASLLIAQYVSLQCITKLKFHSIDMSGQKCCLIVRKGRRYWDCLLKFVLISVTQRGNYIDRKYLIPPNQKSAVKLVCSILP